MEDVKDELGKNEACGRQFIRSYWNRFQQCTRDWISSTGCYSDKGEFLIAPNENFQEDIAVLEDALGQLKRCCDAKLPLDMKAGSPIPLEACRSEVMDAVSSLLYINANREPIFLRLALTAVRQYELARLLERLPAKSQSSTGEGVMRLVLGVLAFIGILGSPVLIGYALHHIAQGEVGSAIIWLYATGAVVLLVLMLKGLADEKEKSPDEIAYYGWLRLSHFGVGSWLDTGVGASAYLNQMLSKGAIVPPVALDLCAMLTHRVESKN